MRETWTRRRSSRRSTASSKATQVWESPSDPRFAAVADDVTGFTTPAELAVLNLAARLLPDGEAYLEVGTFKGRSLCGVLVDAA